METLRFLRLTIIILKIIIFCFFLPALGLKNVLAESPPSAMVDAEGNRYISIGQAQSEITIDGSLDDEDWEKVTFQNHFLQREPVYGQETSEEIQVAVLKDEDYLYLGIRCYDSSFPDIIANEMRRDTRIDDEKMEVYVPDNYAQQTTDLLREELEHE